MLMFDLREIRVIPASAVLDTLDCSKICPRKLLEQLWMEIEEKDYKEEVKFVVRQVAPQYEHYWQDKEDDETVVLLRETGVKKMLDIYARLMVDVITAKPRIRRIK